jgi:hypothetical protein
MLRVATFGKFLLVGCSRRDNVGPANAALNRSNEIALKTGGRQHPPGQFLKFPLAKPMSTYDEIIAVARISGGTVW